MNSSHERCRQTTVAARIAAEDIRPGDLVSVLNDIIELPSFLWCCSSSLLPADEPVRTKLMSREAGLPFRVVTICIPFVYAKCPRGNLTILDTRQRQLVRLDPKAGSLIWRRMRRARQSR